MGLIPGTHLDSPNPWFDKLRRGTWDNNLNRYILSTSEGFFIAEESLRTSLKPMNIQPPVSVMGCNVLERIGQSQYLIGSFSGLFIWDIPSHTVLDAFTQKVPVANSGRPISDHMVTGYYSPSGNSHLYLNMTVA